MKINAISNAINDAATRLGLSARAASTDLEVVVSPIKLAYELGLWILRFNPEDGFSVNDGAGVLSEHYISFFKNLTDDAALADDVSWEFTKALHDDAGLTDDQVIDFFKTLVNQANVTDVQSMALIKDLRDSLWVTDDPDGAASIADEQTMAFIKGRTDMAAVSDAFQSMSFDKALVDSALITDTGSLRSQGYCEFSYFAEDFVGASRSF